MSNILALARSCGLGCARRLRNGRFVHLSHSLLRTPHSLGCISHQYRQTAACKHKRGNSCKNQNMGKRKAD